MKGDVPSIMNPWYVVQSLATAFIEKDVIVALWYTSEEDTVYSRDKGKAHIFSSLAAATRVADGLGEDAEIRVLTSRREAEEFGR